VRKFTAKKSATARDTVTGNVELTCQILPTRDRNKTENLWVFTLTGGRTPIMNNNHGGKRQNAGRKLPPDGEKVTASFSLSQPILNFIRSNFSKGKKSSFVERSIRDSAEFKEFEKSGEQNISSTLTPETKKH
jgi:hypothetical protein